MPWGQSCGYDRHAEESTELELTRHAPEQKTARGTYAGKAIVQPQHKDRTGPVSLPAKLINNPAIFTTDRKSVV